MKHKEIREAEYVMLNVRCLAYENWKGKPGHVTICAKKGSIYGTSVGFRYECGLDFRSFKCENDVGDGGLVLNCAYANLNEPLIILLSLILMPLTEDDVKEWCKRHRLDALKTNIVKKMFEGQYDKLNVDCLCSEKALKV